MQAHTECLQPPALFPFSTTECLEKVKLVPFGAGNLPTPRHVCRAMQHSVAQNTTPSPCGPRATSVLGWGATQQHNSNTRQQ